VSNAPPADLVAAGALDARLALARQQRAHEHEAAAHPPQQRGGRASWW